MRKYTIVDAFVRRLLKYNDQECLSGCKCHRNSEALNFMF
ncbi:hypothetical protein SAMN04487894_12017 [Niabella drilacis]|uniref:Uncharacterized protein n=1 Tax=Niabella drilacis (strain DSM 25811 / CCM 8410 / CCUG 62505 / LMG 26954 / E90) TaxID=1285928 RepID=A0A1G7A0X1_NIADE|nr:hypothetical protein SAMN04487894_12017 [Niabella drilacis]